MNKLRYAEIKREAWHTLLELGYALWRGQHLPGVLLSLKLQDLFHRLSALAGDCPLAAPHPEPTEVTNVIPFPRSNFPN